MMASLGNFETLGEIRRRRKIGDAQFRDAKFGTPNLGRAKTGVFYLLLSSSCSNENFLTPQTPNPNPTNPSCQPKNYLMDRLNPRQTKCTLTLT